MPTSSPNGLCFDEFTLDTVRCVLLRGTVERPLRRQSFEVLSYLAAHAGKVVSSDEIVEALWSAKPADHNASVGQCIKEIRQAIGQDARWIIKTVSGRGYEFMAKVVPFVSERPNGGSSVALPQAAEARPAVGTTEAAAGAAKLPSMLVSERPFWRPDRLPGVALFSMLFVSVWMLWSWRHPAPPDGALTMMAAPSIAVLPFTTVGSQEPHFLAGGLEAEVRSELARAHRGFDLIIRSGTGDPDRSSSPKVAGTRFGVRYLVVGTTWLDRDIQHASIQLVDAETDRQTWSESFELNRGQNVAINRVAARIARLIIIQVRTAESHRPLPVKVEAGHYVLQGRALHEAERGPKSTTEAQSLFKKALQLEANSVSALQGFATTRLIQVHNAWIPHEQRYSALIEAEEAIERLVKLEPGNPAGHYLRASLLRALGEPDRAIASLEYALSLNPNYFAAHAELGRIKVDAGRAHESIGHIEDAIELNPPEPNVHLLYFWAGFAALHVSDEQAAVQWLLKARQVNPAFTLTSLYLAAAYLGIGEEEKARKSLTEYLKVVPKFSIGGWKRTVPTPNAIVAKQRERIFDAWRRLGVPEDNTPMALY